MAQCDHANDLNKWDKQKDLFSRAAEHIQANAGKLASDQLLYLYARYKQAHDGPCKSSRPAFYDLKGRQKWDAWRQLGDMSATTAMDEYVKFVCQLFPDWSPEELKSGARPMLGAVVSRPCVEPGVAPENKDAFDWAKEGCLERLVECLSNNAMVHERDVQGMSLLHWACDRGHLEVVKLLLDRGADSDAKDAEGQTPLHYAASCGHQQVAELLLKQGASRDVKDADGQTPAQVALSPELEALLSPS